MPTYDPQVRRTRPSPSVDSPVDGLLEAVPDREADPPAAVSEAPAAGNGTPAPDPTYGLGPFEAPSVEMTDERADLLHRLGVLGAVAVFALVLAMWRRRRRAD